MKKLKNIFTTLNSKVNWVYVFFFLLGSLIGIFFCNFHYFVFEKTIKITDILSALLTVFIGLYIASKIQSRVSSDRIEKDLIINELKDIKSNINRLNDLVDSKRLEFEDLLKVNKSISQNLTLTVKLIAHCNYDEEIFNSVKKILTEFRLINRSLTFVRPNANNIIILSDAKCFDISSKLKLIQERIMIEMISINRI